jgi:hypothetical protein
VVAVLVLDLLLGPAGVAGRPASWGHAHSMMAAMTSIGGCR